MSLVFAGVCSHGPGITGRKDMADPQQVADLYTAFSDMREQMEAARPEVLVVVAAEHFANFFMDNMPAYCMGMAENYTGPIEDPDWLGIARSTFPGAPDLSRRLIEEILHDVDVAYAEEWRFDHGISVPLHFLTPGSDLPIIPVNINCQGPPLTPLHRAWAFGEALGNACRQAPERIAIVATGGISHWPATPDSGKINEEWDREFLNYWQANDKAKLLAYTDEQTLAEAGQGGFEIRTFIALSGATQKMTATVHYYQPIPIFAVGCTIGTVQLE